MQLYPASKAQLLRRLAKNSPREFLRLHRRSLLSISYFSKLQCGNSALDSLKGTLFSKNCD